jgi:hypothetical protein
VFGAGKKTSGDFSLSGSWPGGVANAESNVTLAVKDPYGDWPMHLTWDGRTLTGTATEGGASFAGKDAEVLFSCGAELDMPRAEGESSSLDRKSEPRSRNISIERFHTSRAVAHSNFSADRSSVAGEELSGVRHHDFESQTKSESMMLMSNLGVHFQGTVWGVDTTFSIDISNGNVLGVGQNRNGNFTLSGSWPDGLSKIPGEVFLTFRNAHGDWPLELEWNGRSLIGVTTAPASVGGQPISASFSRVDSGIGTLRFTGNAWGDPNMMFVVHIDSKDRVFGAGKKTSGDFSLSGSWPGGVANAESNVTLTVKDPYGDWPMHLTWDGRTLAGTATEGGASFAGKDAEVLFSCGVELVMPRAERESSSLDRKVLLIDTITTLELHWTVVLFNR